MLAFDPLLRGLGRAAHAAARADFVTLRLVAMRRREFILISSAAVCWPLAARAQQPVGMPRIGVLMGIGDGDPEAKPRVEALQTGLRELGWTEGHNIHLDYRWTAGDPRPGATICKRNRRAETQSYRRPQHSGCQSGSSMMASA